MLASALLAVAAAVSVVSATPFGGSSPLGVAEKLRLARKSAIPAQSFSFGDAAVEAAAPIAKRQVAIPTTFEWSSTGPLIYPKNDSEALAGIKDPSIIEVNGVYHVFASTAKEAGYSLVYLNFTDFNQAEASTFNYLDQTPIGSGYRAAPTIFYFAPQSLWYLVFQNGNAAYSTNKNLGDPQGWTAPVNFFSAEPAIIAANIGSGYWVDMWPICDATMCYIFSSDDNGHLYRSETTLASFPNGMGNTVIAKTDDTSIYDLFEASNVYYFGGEYLLIVEAIGSDGDRYFRSWTSPTLTGTWTPLQNQEPTPFASHYNVVFPGGAWTQSISHGEAIRTVVDQTLTLSPCNLRYLFQGVDPASTADYNALPWKLGLLTQTNSICNDTAPVSSSSSSSVVSSTTTSIASSTTSVSSSIITTTPPPTTSSAAASSKTKNNGCTDKTVKITETIEKTVKETIYSTQTTTVAGATITATAPGATITATVSGACKKA
ncbi:hypothetical protein MMC25_005070 [Agyrium rufum]|nr:hypothetical protein [Agyrium rufum]